MFHHQAAPNHQPEGTGTMAKRELITASRARQLLDYNPETGNFKWKVGRGGVATGSPAGCNQFFKRECGYRRVIRIDGRLYLSYRLAWLIIYGEFPPDGIDHKNGNPLDNRISNLRPASQRENSRNTRIRSNNKSKFKGVSWDKINRKWVARIREPNGSYLNLGRFDAPELAGAAYETAAKLKFGEFARVK